MTDTERTFTTKAQVLTYLVAQGFDVKQSAFYEKAKYWLHADDGKKYTLRAVDKFIQGADLKRIEEGAQEAREIQDDARREKKATADLREEQAQMAALRRRNREGELIERTEVERMLTTRAVNLKAGLRNFARSRMEDLVLATGGDLERVAEGMRLWEDATDELLHRYATEGEIKVEAPR